MSLRPAIAALGLACALAAPARAGQVIDRVVAVVDGQVITLTGLEFEARVATVSRGGTLAARGELPRELLQSALLYALGQRLAYHEAETLKVVEVEQGEVDGAVEAFAERLGGQSKLAAFLAEQEVPLGDLAVLLRRDLAVGKFLETQVRLEAKVTDAQLDAYLAAHPDLLGARPTREAREALRNKLVKERYQALTLQVLKRLRARAKVRIVDPEFAGADAALLAAASPE